ncbi:chromate efflux transporter [Virgibacillus oceani]
MGFEKKKTTTSSYRERLLEALQVAAKLGVTAFGGPIAHLGYFRDEYIARRKWTSDANYTNLIALSQMLPGPASSKVGTSLGFIRAGFWGGFLSFLAFTLPSSIALVLFAYLLQGYDLTDAGWLNGLKIVAVAIVAHALIGMAKRLTPDWQRITIALIVIGGILLWDIPYIQILFIVVGGLSGILFLKNNDMQKKETIQSPFSRRTGLISLAAYFALLIILPIISYFYSNQLVSLFDSFYRAGALVFGGGHVLLPLLENEVIATNLMDADTFLAGYGAAQAVPGPMFTFASYLGAIIYGIPGAIITTIAIFLPGFLLVIGTLPFFSYISHFKKVQSALIGINAAVVGILAAAWFDPIITNAISSVSDVVLAIALFVLIHYWKVSPLFVVAIGAAAGFIIG